MISPNARRRSRSSSALPAPRLDWAYFFDIDGTVVAIADTPGRARLEPRFRRALEALYRASGGAVALISGRGIADVDRLFGGTRIPVAGQHGVERRDAAGRIHRPPAAPAALAPARELLASLVVRHPGLLLEDKGLSLALHYRRAPRLAGYVHRVVGALAEALGPDYRLQIGKRVVELKPAGKDKGVAVLEFMVEDPFRGRTPVFVGDDVTDEFGFAAVNRLRGHSVKVGPGSTAARWRLPDVAAVLAWLERGPGPETS